MKTKKYLRYLLPALGVVAILSYLILGHRHPEFTETPFQHFQDKEDIVQLVIETDISALLTASEDPDYQPAKLTLKKNNCIDEHFQIDVKPRGVYRRKICTFPPLKIHFSDEVLEAGQLKDYPSLKLVTHCREDISFDQLVLKEHLAFKLYNVLTDNSFRTQLAKITYCDSEKKHPNTERYGFLIESPKELADRMQGRILGEEFGTPKTIHKPQYKIFTVFQYMIGNTDWALKNRHNLKLIDAEDDNVELPIPVPYDFDFCGLVDAPYAVPHYSHPISDVKERYFQWYGGKDEDFTEVFTLFKEKKSALTAVVEQCRHLEPNSKMEMHKYLNSFFELLDTPAAIVQE